jgi:hypothetical protein
MLCRPKFTLEISINVHICKGIFHVVLCLCNYYTITIHGEKNPVLTWRIAGLKFLMCSVFSLIFKATKTYSSTVVRDKMLILFFLLGRTNEHL